MVEEGQELSELKNELVSKLTGLVDEQYSEVSINEVIETDATHGGPYKYDAPDLLIGYNAGYRSSWTCAVGKVTDSVFEDNTKHWSGDHCVDPNIVPGVLFSNLKVTKENPHLKDMAPTVLKLFGVNAPKDMQGSSLFENVNIQEENNQ